ncbi:MAG: c-type cytochrome [Arenicellales bacterium]
MSDAQFANIFGIMIGSLVVIAILLIILAKVVSSGVNQSSVSADVRNAQVAKQLEPVGQITIGQEPASSESTAPAAGQQTQAVSGEAVYKGTCIACHGTGAAGAPVFGNAQAWAPHIAKGIETLYQHALHGFQGKSGVMPPKGGNSSLTDAQVKAGVDYMVHAAQK